MGLFSIFGNKKSAEQNKETVSEFYVHCSEVCHSEAQKCGFAPKGEIPVPALMPMGESVLHSILQDRYYQMKFGANADLYNFVIMSMSIRAGIILGYKWHENYEELTDMYIMKLVKEGPAEEAKPIVLSELGLSAEDEERVFKQIFTPWNELLVPHKKDKDFEEYYFKGLQTAFQLGISIILGKY